MTILLEGLQRIRDRIFDDIDKGQLGTGGNASNENDTGLGTAVTNTLLALETKSKANKTIQFTYKLPSTGGTSTTFREFELARTSGTAIVTDYDRIVYTGISFTTGGSEDFSISKKYFIRRV